MSTTKTVTLKYDNRSASARVGIGAGFIRTDTMQPVPGNWSGVEMERNHQAQAIGVPCQMWDKSAHVHRFYMLIAA
jgi:hypothetical protein